MENNKNNTENNAKNELSNVNCKEFFNNFTKCVEQKTNIFGELKKVNIEPNNFNYFNFFDCKEYKSVIESSRLKIKSINFNPNDIVYPYNCTYTIKNMGGEIKIRFYD